LNGLDDIDYLLSRKDKIEAYESHPSEAPLNIESLNFESLNIES
jgi:hypothetical protein